jgi:transcriptional regulator with XRE-family HTH domain
MLQHPQTEEVVPMNNARETLPARLRGTREALRLSQREVASRASERAGVSLADSQISRYETGEMSPSLANLEAIAMAFCIDGVLVCTAADLLTPGWEPELPEGF